MEEFLLDVELDGVHEQRLTQMERYKACSKERMGFCSLSSAVRGTISNKAFPGLGNPKISSLCMYPLRIHIRRARKKINKK